MSAPDDEGERILRWRLVLGRHAEESLPVKPRASPPAAELNERLKEGESIDAMLNFLYDREFAQRSHRVGAGGGDTLDVPLWLRGVRVLFPKEAVRVIERDALSRYGLTELVTDARVLREAEPTEALVKAVLQFKHHMKGEVLVAARAVVREVVATLAAKVRQDMEPALMGPADPHRRPPIRTFRNADWPGTIRANLKHYNTDREQLIVDRVQFRHRMRDRARWRIIVAVDQSGSMADSLIHASVMAAIFASLPHVALHLVLWDHRVQDVSRVAHDPLEVLMSVQLGGGTDLRPALSYCASLVTEPEKTLLVMISDLFLSGDAGPALKVAEELVESGVTCLSLLALTTDGEPQYDEHVARRLAAVGFTVGAMTPRALADHVGRILR